MSIVFNEELGLRPAGRPEAERLAGAQSVRFALRDATAQAHQRLDRLYSGFDLADPVDYAAFLLAHAPAYLAVERALAAAGADALAPGWSGRRRDAALLADIAAMGLAEPRPATAPVFRTQAEILGSLYVLEGSRLGATVLVRGVAPGLPKAFLSPGNPTDWRAFLAVLEARLSSKAMLAQATSAALTVFSLFERAARTQLEPKDPWTLKP